MHLAAFTPTVCCAMQSIPFGMHRRVLGGKKTTPIGCWGNVSQSSALDSSLMQEEPQETVLLLHMSYGEGVNARRWGCQARGV